MFPWSEAIVMFCSSRHRMETWRRRESRMCSLSLSLFFSLPATRQKNDCTHVPHRNISLKFDQRVLGTITCKRNFAVSARSWGMALVCECKQSLCTLTLLLSYFGTIWLFVSDATTATVSLDHHCNVKSATVKTVASCERRKSGKLSWRNISWMAWVI